MDGTYKPKSQVHIAKIAEKYPEVYEVLGITPEPELYDQVPPPYRDRLKAALTEITDTLNKGQVPPASRLGQRLARDIFAKHGFDVSSITTDTDLSPTGDTT